MSDERGSEGLAQVYAATTPLELTQAYAAWAHAYDRETVASGYCLPFVIAAWVARYVPKGTGPLLDAGCGTGLSGPALKALGYDDIAGLDMSPEMLQIAGSRQAYGELKQAALGGTLPWPDDHFAAFFSTGVFTQGHAPASSLEELVRITRPGGTAIFTVRDVVLESDGFLGIFKTLEDDGRWRVLEDSPAFRAFAIDEPDVLVKAFAFEVL